MTSEEIELWILDTISEGDYSFTELYRYISKVGLNYATISTHLLELLMSGMISVHKFSNDKATPYDIDDQVYSLKEFENIVKKESVIASEHFFSISKNGLAYLQRRLGN